MIVAVILLVFCAKSTRRARSVGPHIDCSRAFRVSGLRHQGELINNDHISIILERETQRLEQSNLNQFVALQMLLLSSDSR